MDKTLGMGGREVSQKSAKVLAKETKGYRVVIYLDGNIMQCLKGLDSGPKPHSVLQQLCGLADIS